MPKKKSAKTTTKPLKKKTNLKSSSTQKTPAEKVASKKPSKSNKALLPGLKKVKLKGFKLPQLKRRYKIILWLSGFSLTLLIGLSLLYIKDLPSPSKLTSQEYPVSSIIMDREGETLYEVYSDTNRSPVTLDQMPVHVRQATIAIEDKNFYRHWGFSIQGITRAATNTLFKQKLQGGSTITQQLVKVALLTPERTLERKIKEAFLTVGTEVLYSKDEILEMYLNHIPYGGTAWGIETAAKTFFNKPASQLELHEAAFLAGLPQAPSRFSPFGSTPEQGVARQHEVLRRMVEEGFITQEQADEAKETELAFATNNVTVRAPHFAFYVRDLLIEKFGEDLVESGGLRVKTTLDLNIQEDVQASVSAEIESLQRYDVGNGAALVTRPHTGEILAMVGSKDFFNSEDDGQVNVTLRQRQPGSSIKPINYAIAFETQKATAATMLLDIPTCFQSVGQEDYCPKNYDNSFRGAVLLRDALANSYNIHAVKVLALNGLESFVSFARRMGIQSFQDPANYGLSLTLGGGEVTMLEMATAFGTLANQGVNVPLQPILEVTDWQGNVLERYDPGTAKAALEQITTDPELQRPGSFVDINDSHSIRRVLHREPAYIVSDILQDNNARAAAFGTNSQLRIPGQNVSAKTGTTNNLRDNWTIGYTAELLTAVWVGNNDNTPMNPYLVSGVTGAAPIFNDIMSHLLQGVEPIEQAKPDEIVERPVCRTTGLVPNPDSPCEIRTEIFWEGTEPGEFEQVRKEIWVKNDTGFQPEPGDTENLKLESHLVLSDPFTQDYCLDCNLPTDEEGKPIRPVATVRFPLEFNDDDNPYLNIPAQ